ncbi:amino acid-binding protein [Deltaproteobacteria bacterium]|nr:amino acid-binding protein [Deltaproteobacteria bacterium]
MKLEQLSIFLENKAGRLAEVTDVLAKAGINIRALSLADTTDFGILRIIVNDQEKAKKFLREAGFAVSLTPVIAVEVPHKPGGLNAVLQLLGKRDVNVEYMYAFLQKEDNAVLIFRVNRLDLAMEVLAEAGITVLDSVEACACGD